MNKQDKIYVAGHHGLVGSAIVRQLLVQGFDNLVLCSRNALDLCNQSAVLDFFAQHKPNYVFLAAAKVGGINANNIYPADFIRDNLNIQNNIIDSAYQTGCNKLLFLGSSCIYPKFAEQPMKEDCLLTGPLEPTNQWYAIAKIAGIKMCQAYQLQYGFNAISLMPTNLYGPGDNFHLQNSHVLPALLRKFHDAKQAGDASVPVWGTGSAKREFLHVDDLAHAAVFLMQNYDSPEIINVGCGKDISIGELASLVKQVVGYQGEIAYDSSKPDGTPRKLLDTSKIEGLGWNAKIGLEEGIASTYQWYLDHQEDYRQ